MHGSGSPREPGYLDEVSTAGWRHRVATRWLSLSHDASMALDHSAAMTFSTIAVDDSIEALFARHDTGSRSVYVATLAFTVAGVAIASATSVDITFRAPATLVPAIARQTLRSLSEGPVERMLVSAGSTVKAGDTLVALSTNAVEQAISATTAALETQRSRYADLHALLDARAGELAGEQLHLPQSRAIARATTVEWKQGSVQVARAERTYDRAVQLMQRGFAVPTEAEAAQFDLARAREERSLALERRRSAWALELADAEQRIADSQRDRVALMVTKATRYVIAPLSGTAEEISALTRGSVLRAGDPVAMISPDGAVFAEALVAPRDVASLRVGMPARLIIEGYDVQEWGSADAIVTSVARDYTLVNGHPVFRVRMRPISATLRRANGTTVRLGKGLRAQARFLVGRQRVVDLVRKRASEWMDPVDPGGR